MKEDLLTGLRLILSEGEEPAMAEYLNIYMQTDIVFINKTSICDMCRNQDKEEKVDT